MGDMIVGGVRIVERWTFYGDNKTIEIPEFYKKLFDGRTIKAPGFETYGVTETMRITSPKEYPPFTFLVDIEPVPVFLQVGRGFVAMSAGMLFGEVDGDITSKNRYFHARLVDKGLWRIAIKTNNWIGGDYYSDGKRLWRAIFGKKLEEIEFYKKAYNLDDIIFYRDTNYIIGIKEDKYVKVLRHERVKEVNRNLVDKRVKIVYGPRTVYAPKFYKNLIFPEITAGGVEVGD